MPKQQRSLIDELADRTREFVENLERLLQPEQQEPARVPVRVPTEQRRRRRR